MAHKAWIPAAAGDGMFSDNPTQPVSAGEQHRGHFA
jgi:hypothetical protein